MIPLLDDGGSLLRIMRIYVPVVRFSPMRSPAGGQPHSDVSFVSLVFHESCRSLTLPAFLKLRFAVQIAMPALSYPHSGPLQSFDRSYR